MDTLRYYHTLRHLKPVQIYGRLLHRLHQPGTDVSPPPQVRAISGHWTATTRKRTSSIGPVRFRFLNEEHDIAGPEAWNAPYLEKLWLYNLHYFDFLREAADKAKVEWLRALIGRWVAENPPGKGTGWEPYPTSLRIVNWIKWVLSHNRLETDWLRSLAVQTRWLAKRMEIHLLGNHLFANAKALVFSGFFFDGQEAARWLDRGMSILAREIPEQIHSDGGHFELSPMYHALALEDMLDLVNLAAAYPNAVPERWRSLISSWPETIGRMRCWLAGLCHPDGEIAFFNDAAIGIALAPAELDEYASRLGLVNVRGWPARSGFVHFTDSGYIRAMNGDMTALLDVARVGPDYLPGHAHADTLSFELSLERQRVLVNSGTSCYGLSDERLRQRGTAAHNTVTVDGKDSSEVWSGFRVARRASPFGLVIEQDASDLHVACAHDGYKRLPGKPVHRREWTFSKGSLEIVDTIEGEFHGAVGRLFFHPDLQVSADDSCATGHARLPGGRVIDWRVEGAAANLASSTYHPEFGLAQPNQCLETRFSTRRSSVRLTWT